jgi:hypothetical protein
MVAGRMGRKDAAKHAVVHTSVHIGEPKEMSGFGIAVDIKVEGVDEELLKAGHEVCVYPTLVGLTDHPFSLGLPVQSCPEVWRCRERIKGVTNAHL